MKSQVALLLICTLFSKALSLTCYNECMPEFECTGNHNQCSDQCLTATTSVYMSGAKVTDVTLKNCDISQLCVNGSMNLGIVKMVSNAKCCSTDLCNNDTLAAPLKQTPNGRMCYTCNASDCTAEISCEGTEDRCITASVRVQDKNMPIKGCVSKNLCTVPTSLIPPSINVKMQRCCEGNLCNGAERFKLSFLLMFILLLFIIIFY